MANNVKEKLTPERVREYVRDFVDVNYLLDNEIQFTDKRIMNAMDFAIDEMNAIPPISNMSLENMPSNTRTMLLYGVFKHLFLGEAGKAARNQMSYNDGGLNVPIEERYQYWMKLSEQCGRYFHQSVKQWKVGSNLDSRSSWGSVGSDFANFPYW